MKTKQILIFTLIISFFTIDVYSQSFLERMAKKAKEKAEQKAEKKVENEIDKSIDKTFDSLEKQYKKDERHEEKEKEQEQVTRTSSESNDATRNQALNDLMKKMGVSGTPVPIQDKYVFGSSVTMNFKSYDSSGNIESNGDIISFFSPQNKYIAYEFVDGTIRNAKEKQNGTFILDFDNNATIILEDKNGQKTGLAYGLGDMMDTEEWQEEMDNEPQYNSEDEKAHIPIAKKTGNTKRILGYDCDEYLFEDEDIKTTYWVTRDVAWNNKDLMSNIFANSVYSYETPDGFLMMSVTEDKKTGEKNVYQVIDINKNDNKVFDMSQYQITNLGSMKMPQDSAE
ncbi:MAG: hypothetical protein GXO47_09530 [Chlorobi bacterium]|nr:hypothetical protein [Chlorobiota bacterium]